MTPDPNPPADRENYVSRRLPAEERPDPATFAARLFEHLNNTHGADADLYASRVVAELFEHSSITREHISDLLIADLSEELYRRGHPGREAARMVAEVQRDWSRGDTGQ